MSGGPGLDLDLNNLHIAFFGFALRVNHGLAESFAGFRFAWN